MRWSVMCDVWWLWCVVICLSGKRYICQCRRQKRHKFSPWVEKIPWRRKWQHTLLLLLGKPYGQRGLAGYKSMGSRRVRHNWVWTNINCPHWDSWEEDVKTISYSDMRVYTNFSFLNPMILKGSVVSIVRNLTTLISLGIDITSTDS